MLQYGLLHCGCPGLTDELMKYYTASAQRLNGLPFALRMILSLYLLVTLLGFAIATLKYAVRGFFISEGGKHYLGDGEIEMAKGLDFYVDTVHPHLFTVPLVLLVLCHLYQLCRGPQWLKNSLYLTAFGGLGLTFFLPWLLLWQPTWGSWVPWLILFGGLSLIVSGILLCVLSLVDLWSRSSSAEKHEAAD